MKSNLLLLLFFFVAINTFAQPANNECINAIALTVGPSCVYTLGTTSEATQSAQPTSCTGNADDDVWYSFAYTANQNIVVGVIGTFNFDAVLELSSNCGSTNLGCSNNTGLAGTEMVSYSNASSSTLYVRVYHGGGFSGSGTFSITVTSANIPSVTVSNSGPVCSGTTLSLSASGGTTYSWSGPNSFSSASQNPTIDNILASGSGNYAVTASGAGGCFSMATTSVTVIQSPAPPSNPTSNSPQCADAGALITRSGTPSGGEAWYWQGTSCGNSTTNSTATYSVASSGTYFIRAYNSSTQCWSSACGSAAVVINTNPSAPTASNVTVCQNVLPASLTASASGSQIDWYSSATGGSSLLSNSTTYTTSTAGNYYAESKDATTGCVSTSRTLAALTINPNPTINVLGTTAICQGKTATLTASGGTSYSWSPGGQVTSSITVNPLTSIVYTVIGSNASSCTSTTTVGITVNPLPSLSLSSNTPICNSLTLNLTADTVTGATYNWTGPNSFISNTQNPSKNNTTVADSGWYYCTVTDANSCSKKDSVLASITQIPTASIAVGANTAICQGDSMLLTATNGTAYLWSNGATTQAIQAMTSGTYSCMVTNPSGCSGNASTQNVSVTVKPTPGIPVIIQSGDTLSCSVTASTYQWYFNGIIQPADTTQMIVIAPAQNGTWTVLVGNNNGCYVSSSGIASDVAVRELLNDNTLAVYPNPTRGIVSIETENYNVLSVYNVLGMNLYSSPIFGGKTIIDLSHQPQGIYFIKVISGNSFAVRKIVKE